jgi:nondiscriminating aspartyl-tRNA synthetase
MLPFQLEDASRRVENQEDEDESKAQLKQKPVKGSEEEKKA